MKRILWFAFIQIVIMVSTQIRVLADERRDFYSGSRCLAMGGACLAVVNDETSLLVNAAALGKLRDVYGTVFDPEIEFNSNAQDMYQDSSFSNPYELSDVSGALNANKDQYYHAKMQLFPSLVMKYFGLGVYYNNLLDAKMSADGTTIDTYHRSDLAVVMGFNVTLFSGRVKIGASSKLIDRIEVDNDTLSSSGSLDYNSIATSGVGVSNDVSIILAAPWTFIPTLSAKLHDIGGTSFNLADGTRLSTTNRPNVVAQDLDVAAAIFPIHSNNTRSSWTVEYRGLLTSSSEDDKAKLIHAGFEYNFGDVLFLRAGYNQRYWTAGFEIASEHWQWQLTSYGEEIGTSTSPKEDRRYNLKFALRF